MRKYPSKISRPRLKKNSVSYLLEKGTLESLKAAKNQTEKLLIYAWKKYAELAQQRNQVNDELKKALHEACISNYTIKNWQRAVKYKYGLHPFSTVGSLKGIGGRFNMGENINSEVPTFPALYLAADKDTALQEHLGQTAATHPSILNSRELALSNPQSETIISVSAKFDRILDLTKLKNLSAFIAITKKFKFSTQLKQQAEKMGDLTMKVIQTAKRLHDTLLATDWRFTPIMEDIPANSQIFGHLVYSAGIEGILYLSKFTGKPCLAVFPKNLSKTESFIQIDDETPHEGVPKLINSDNWYECDLTFEEILLRKSMH